MYIVHVQELNSKAENKFNKLKSQAKNKIASLTKEVESLRVTRGEESMVNVSTLVSSTLTCQWLNNLT